MKKDIPSVSAELDIRKLSEKAKPSWVVFALLLLVYTVTTVLVATSSRSDAFFTVNGAAVPYRAITGALSSAANLCIIFMVVLFRKSGFVTSLVLLLSQFPMLIVELFVQQNYTGVSGLFANLLIVLSICLLYVNDKRIFKYQLAMQEYATTDRLTKLPNRNVCYVHAEKLIRENEPFAIAILNINHFKNIKNSMGQSMGDAILSEISSRLKTAVEKDSSTADTYLAYNDNDEFTFIVRNCHDDDLFRLFEYYQSAFDEPVTVNGYECFVSARIGYAEYPDDAVTIETLYSCALIAMTNARDHGDNFICRFTPDMYDAEREIATEKRIREAIKDQRLKFYLQPQYDISHKLRGFEVLARIFNEDGTLFSPAEFIPVAEKVGLVDSIDYTVFKESAEFLRDVIQCTSTDIIFSVNVSVRHLMKKNFLNEVKEVLESTGISADRIEIEITESLMINSVDEALKSINELKKLGFHIAIDDFGTGYSSLSYLNSFPADVVKIDKSFVEKISLGSSYRQYVAAIISIGHIMNFKVIAEGVETKEEFEILRDIGCDYIQGFYWGMPMPPDNAERLIVEDSEKVSASSI